MKFQRHVEKGLSVSFLQKGDHPVLLLLSGVHGDERGVIESVLASVDRSWSQLPQFVYVPEVSPSAVQLGTRKNQEGFDVNRVFYEGSPSREVRAVQSLLMKHRFQYSINFHEDLETDQFYLYDLGRSGGSPWCRALRDEVEGAGFAMYSGIDDPRDGTLGFDVDRGYVSVDLRRDAIGGTLEEYLHASGSVHEQSTIIEIPGKKTESSKDIMISIAFRMAIAREASNA